MPRISVFTPTYNRAGLISRVFDSLNDQTYRDFEWIVIDDGSTDNTSEVLNRFKKDSSYDVKIVSRENRGKVNSINEALDYARGELFIVFDSDDWCIPTAFERIIALWEAVPEQDRGSYSGVSCLKCLVDGSVVGDSYPEAPGDLRDYIQRYDLRVPGDKWEIIRTDVHQSYRYDLAKGEKYMAPEYAWIGMGQEYKTVFSNEALSVVEYQADGISANNLRHRTSSPISCSLFYARAVRVSRTLQGKVRAGLNFARFYFHGKGASGIAIPGYLFALFAAPGFLMYLQDRWTLARPKGS